MMSDDYVTMMRMRVEVLEENQRKAAVWHEDAAATIKNVLSCIEDTKVINRALMSRVEGLEAALKDKVVIGAMRVADAMKAAEAKAETTVRTLTYHETGKQTLWVKAEDDPQITALVRAARSVGKACEGQPHSWDAIDMALDAMDAALQPFESVK